MRYQTETQADWTGARIAGGLPAPRDCETMSLLRGFLTPILESATSWSDLRASLDQRGYGLAFREGHLVILDDAGEGMCTGSSIGVPLRVLAARLGRPAVRATHDGHSGELN